VDSPFYEKVDTQCYTCGGFHGNAVVVHTKWLESSFGEVWDVYRALPEVIVWE